MYLLDEVIGFQGHTNICVRGRHAAFPIHRMIQQHERSSKRILARLFPLIKNFGPVRS